MKEAHLAAWQHGTVDAKGYLSWDAVPYLDAVLNETLRLLPPISLGTIRQARTRMQLRGYDIPKGAYINVRSVVKCCTRVDARPTHSLLHLCHSPQCDIP